MIGRVIQDRYEIRQELGQGGMATVFLAQDRQLDRLVAIKILHPHLARQEYAVERFHREATTVARLRHPNIIEIFDYSGLEASEPYIVMEYVEGWTLSRILKAYRLGACELVACVFHQVVLALEHAHGQGIIHRDLKPENIMIGKDGRLKLMDFGIARVLEASTLTMTGSILGSPAYMSPEHATGKNIGFHSDIFSLGSIVYQMTTGQPPFDGMNPHVVLKQIIEGDHVDGRMIEPTLSNEFNQILERCLAVDLQTRYATVEPLVKDLHHYLEQAGIRNSNEMMRKLFMNLQEFPTQYRDELITRLRSEAKQDFQTQPMRALQRYQRLLAFLPDDEEANERVEQILRRQRREEMLKTAFRLIGGGALACVLVLGVVYVAFPGLFSNKGDGVSAAEQGLPPVNELREATPQTGPMSEEPTPDWFSEYPVSWPDGEDEVNLKPTLRLVGDRPIRRTNEMRARLMPVNPLLASADGDAEPEPMEGTLTLQVGSWAKVFIDDAYVGDFPEQRSFSLTGGVHRIRLENPAFEPLTENVRVNEDGQSITLRRKMVIRPAVLNVVYPHPAVIWVNGRQRGSTPDSPPINIRVAKETTVTVELRRPDGPPLRTSLSIAPGRQVRFEPSDAEGMP